MKTFTAARVLVKNPVFQEQRRASLSSLDLGSIDAPIADIITRFAEIRYCFTVQSCYGHFVYPGQQDSHSLEPLPLMSGDKELTYRIAYIALVIEDCEAGRKLLSELMHVPGLDPYFIQFGCADWFWKRQVNSYALQVEPDRFKNLDTATVAYEEALHIERTRNAFFGEIRHILSGLPSE